MHSAHSQGRLKKAKHKDSQNVEEELLEADLELLPVYTRSSSRNKVTEKEMSHLRALKLVNKALTKFDLSKNEVKVYLFLARFGSQKAQVIAESLSVHRTETYKILRRLERQGLVTCVFERPMKFVAVSFDKALENLIEERRQRVYQLEQRKKELVEVWHSLPEPENVKMKNETFQVLEGRRQISVKAKELLENCKQEMLMVFSDTNLLWLYNSPFFDDLEALYKKRPLKIRLLTNFSPTSSYVLERINFGEGDFAYLLTDAPDFLVTDTSEMFLLMQKRKEDGDKPLAMWTNYESIIQSFRLLFSLIWNKKSESPLLYVARNQVQSEHL